MSTRDEDDERRKREIIPDGGRVRIPLEFMDGLQKSVAAARQPIRHQPGFAVIADADRDIRIAVDATRKYLLAQRWRQGPQPVHPVWSAKTDLAALRAEARRRLSQRWKGAHFGSASNAR